MFTLWGVSSVAQPDTNFIQKLNKLTDTEREIILGDLLNDDSVCNKRRNIIDPTGRIIVVNVFNWAIAKLLL